MLICARTRLALRHFIEDTRGTAAVETVIMLPILFWAFLATYVYFDAYKQHSLSVKAAYTIGDLVSRETQGLNDSYISTMHELAGFLNKSGEMPDLRISVAMWDQEDDAYKLDWSEARGSATALDEAGINALADKLPVLPDNERIIVVETWTQAKPLFDIGLSAREIYNLSFTSPRFAPQVAWAEED